MKDLPWGDVSSLSHSHCTSGEEQPQVCADTSPATVPVPRQHVPAHADKRGGN